MFKLLGRMFGRKEKPPDLQVATIEPKTTVLSKVMVVWDYIPVSTVLPKLALLVIKKIPFTLILRVGMNHPYLFLAGMFLGRLEVFATFFFDPLGVIFRLLFL